MNFLKLFFVVILAIIIASCSKESEFTHEVYESTATIHAGAKFTLFNSDFSQPLEAIDSITFEEAKTFPGTALSNSVNDYYAFSINGLDIKFKNNSILDNMQFNFNGLDEVLITTNNPFFFLFKNGVNISGVEKKYIHFDTNQGTKPVQTGGYSNTSSYFIMFNGKIDFESSDKKSY